MQECQGHHVALDVQDVLKYQFKINDTQKKKLFADTITKCDHSSFVPIASLIALPFLTQAGLFP
jgi:hypothetical protein